MYLVFDTETTGKAYFNRPVTDTIQPRIVQIGALLLDGEFREVSSMDVMIRPDGFEIPEDVSAIHGITTEKASKYGVGIKVAFSAFLDLYNAAETIVGHNLDFDIFMAKIEASMLGSTIVEKPALCTMKHLTPVCKIDGPYGYKWPKLMEAHVYCFNEKFEQAHNAMADVRATARLLKWIKQEPATKNENTVEVEAL